MSALNPDASLVRDRIDVRRFPWIRPLVAELAHDFARLRPFYVGDPADRAAWADAIARVRRASRDRASLGRVLDAQLTRRGSPDAARRAAAALAAAGSVAVVTGQQAGAFGGPLYTLLKAVTALQLAERVRREHGVEAAAVFWVEGEDHDWNEVRTATLLDAEFVPRHVTLADPVGAGVRPVSSLRLDDRIGQSIAELQAALPPTEFTADLLATLARRYATGASPSRAFAGWLDDLLGRHGLVVFEADDPAAKPFAASLFARELEAPRTAELAAEAGAAMAALGHAPQVDPTSDGIGLFYLDLDAAGRTPIKRRADSYAVGDRTSAAAEMAAEASSHPERFSPGVLLRPLVQDRIFPTICYVAGPSELAYLGQLRGVYAHFKQEAPLIYPRANATVLDSASLRFLERSGLPLEALAPQDEAALNAFLQRQIPPEVDAAIADLERGLGQQMRGLKDAVAAIDPTLAGAVDTTVDRVRDTLKTLQNKIVQAAKRKDETLRRQFSRTQALAFPGGAPQERALSVPFFINRHGPAFCDQLLASLPLDLGYHYILSL